MTHIDQIIADALAGLPETDVATLAREVVRLREAPSVGVPEPTAFDVNREYFENFANAFTSTKEREAHKIGFLAGVDWFRARAIPADRVLGEGNQFGVGFVEACGMLAAKPFDRPTLAAGLIREGGMIAALAETPSDGPGISILREEMRADLDALRANQGGADHD